MEVDSLKKLNVKAYQATAPQAAPIPKQTESAELQGTRVREHKEAGDMAEQSRKSAEQNAANRYFSEHEQEITESMMAKAIESANKRLLTTGRKLEYKVHEQTNRVMVKIINSETDEVIREIPPEKTLDIFAKVLELAGLLVDEKR